MSLKIRMSRGGTKRRPHYSIVIADSRFPRDGRFIEKIGFHNPLLPKDHAERTKLDLEKAKAWLKKGATPSDRVHRFLAEAGVLQPLKRNNPEKAKPKKKRQEREAGVATAPAKEPKPAEEAPAKEEKTAEEAPAKEEKPAEEAPAAPPEAQS